MRKAVEKPVWRHLQNGFIPSKYKKTVWVFYCQTIIVPPFIKQLLQPNLYHRLLPKQRRSWFIFKPCAQTLFSVVREHLHGGRECLDVRNGGFGTPSPFPWGWALTCSWVQGEGGFKSLGCFSFPPPSLFPVQLCQLPAEVSALFCVHFSRDRAVHSTSVPSQVYEWRDLLAINTKLEVPVSHPLTFPLLSPGNRECFCSVTQTYPCHTSGSGDVLGGCSV